MINLNKKYVIGTHVMFLEIEMYRDFIDGLINLLEDIENKENVYIDLCFNVSQLIERINTSQITEKQLISKFKQGVKSIENLGIKNIKNG